MTFPLKSIRCKIVGMYKKLLKATNKPKEDPSVSKIGLHHIGFPEGADEEGVNILTKQMLFRRLNMRRVVAFIGSGISKAYGYEGWDHLTRNLVEKTRDILKEVSIPLDESTRTLFKGYLRTQDKKDLSSIPRAERNLLMLGSCDEVLRQYEDDIIAHFKKVKKKRVYELHAMVKKEIEKTQENNKKPDDDPLRHLIKGLRIRRFLTTNYDVEIERALVRSLECPLRQLRLDEKHNPISGLLPIKLGDHADTPRAHGPIARSLTFDLDHPEALVQFAIAAPGYEVGVFHLHGITSEPESLIVTEYDYQRVYLQDDPAHRFYREALDLVFSGNTILFVGVGMEEADLLRPLRQFVSEHHREAREWPFFALMEEPDSRVKAIELRRYLYTRFGIKVLYYKGPGSNKTNDTERNRAFCIEVERLSEEWKTWWDGWQEKPAIRKPDFYKPHEKENVMVHHSIRSEPQDFDLHHDEEQVKIALEDNEDKKKDKKKGKKKFAVMVLGSPGAGKGMLGIRLVGDERTFPGSFTKRFYGTTHFTNEFLSTIDAAGNFLLDGKGGAGDSFSRFEQALLDTGYRHLVVIGGLERLLIPTPTTEVKYKRFDMLTVPVGQPINREVERFFEIVREVGKAGPSRIVLTSSIWPAPLEENDVKHVVLYGVRSEESLFNHLSYKNLDDEELLKKFHHAVKGHIYAISVVERVLERIIQAQGKRQGRKWLRGLVSYLTAISFPRREEEIIKAAIKKLRELEEPPSYELMDLLQRVALFGTPVEDEDIVASYPEVFTHDHAKSPKKTIGEALQSLAGMRLLLPIESTKPETLRYTAHTVVRAHVLHELGSLPETPAEPQRLMLSDFASEVTELHPGAQTGHQLAIKCADSLLKQAEEQLPNPHRGIVRAAFGLIRSRWTTPGINRLNHLPLETRHALFQSHIDAFQCRMARLLNVIREARDESRPSWYAEPNDPERALEKIVKPDAMLYADELSWLYNELGLAAYVQGAVHDAYALFRSGQDINRVAERWTYGQRWLQSEINLALVELERAQLSRARYHLESALSVEQENKDKTAEFTPFSEVEARVSGYLALVHHLSGNYTLAERLYQEAIKVSREFGNFRGVSLFSRHSSDLLRLLGRFEEANRQINESIATAESGRHPDLLHYARVAAVNLKKSSPDQSKATWGNTGFLDSALDFAQKVGLPKLQAEVHRVQGLIALDQGDIQLAGRLAMRCLGIASLFGMRLRLTSSLVLLGQVARARGNWGAATQILHSAVELAERQGYTVQSEKARQELTEIPSGGVGDKVESRKGVGIT